MSKWKWKEASIQYWKYRQYNSLVLPKDLWVRILGWYDRWGHIVNVCMCIPGLYEYVLQTVDFNKIEFYVSFRTNCKFDRFKPNEDVYDVILNTRLKLRKKVRRLCCYPCQHKCKAPRYKNGICLHKPFPNLGLLHVHCKSCKDWVCCKKGQCFPDQPFFCKPCVEYIRVKDRCMQIIRFAREKWQKQRDSDFLQKIKFFK